MDKIMVLVLVEKLENRYFISESEMAELNQNQNSKQPNPPDDVRKFILSWK